MALKYTLKQLNDKVFIFYFVPMGVCAYGKEMKSVVKGHQRGFFGGGGSNLSALDSCRDGKMLEALTKSWTLK